MSSHREYTRSGSLDQSSGYKMDVSREHGMIMLEKNKQDVLHALERKARTVKLWQSWHYVSLWCIVSLCLLFDIYFLRCGICAAVISSFVKHSKVRSLAYVVDITTFVICLSNLLVCFYESAKYFFTIFIRNPPKLTRKQAALLGITDQDYYGNIELETISQPQTSTVAGGSSRNFITYWLSTLHFGNWTDQGTKHQSSSNRTWHSFSNRSLGSSFVSGKSGSAFNNSRLFKHSTPLTCNQSSHVAKYSSRSAPLSAKVGSRVSPHSRPVYSIQTTKQLEEYFQKNNESFHSGMKSLSTSFGSSSSLGSGRTSNFSSSFRMNPSGNNSYEIGTAMYDDEQRKVTADENSVVSLVTGSRITVTDKRVSLSPIPLNLVDVSTDLIDGNGRNIASDERGVARNALNDSITFRVIHNATKQSPKKGQGCTSPSSVRRSESTERYRASTNSSPRSQSSGQLSNVIQLSGTTNSPTGKQIPITSSEILNQYKMDAEDFAIAERNLRSWICQTILRPLVAKIDEVNGILTKHHAQLHLKIGHSSVEALHVAASSKNDLLKSPLPYILPYLKVHEKQAYVVKRCCELSADIYMKNFNWQSGGYELAERKEEDQNGYSPPERPWDTHLPTDTQLIWTWFAVYMDARMGANPLANDIETPFSSVFYLKKPLRPSPLQCMKKSFYIYQSSIYPPHFELVLDGGHERFEVDRGSKNFWRTMLLFIQHIRLFNDGRLDNIRIDSKGINLACVLE